METKTISRPVGISEVYDVFYEANLALLAHGAASAPIPRIVQETSAATLVPQVQQAALALLGFLMAHVSAETEEEELAAAAQLQTRMTAIGKNFESTLSTQKRFAKQRMRMAN